MIDSVDLISLCIFVPAVDSEQMNVETISLFLDFSEAQKQCSLPVGTGVKTGTECVLLSSQFWL